MKILVLNGSPKGEGSDTLRLTRAFLDGMSQSAEYVQASKLDVKPCLGCFSCWRQTPGVCVHRDDMPALLDKMMSSDLVIWSFPLYCYSFPAPMKAIIDRTLPLATPRQETCEDGSTYHPVREEHPVRMMLISGCGFPNLKGNYDGLLFEFEREFGADFPRILCAEAPLLGIPQAAPLADAYLALARQAGAEFARDGRIGSETQTKLDTPMYPPDRYRAETNQSF